MKQIPEYIKEFDEIEHRDECNFYGEIRGECACSDEQIKSFLTNALTQQREEIVEMIKGIRKDNVYISKDGVSWFCRECGGQEDCQCWEHNQALDTIINNLKQYV